MLKIPKTVTILEATRALNTYMGAVVDLTGVRLVTGHEEVPVTKLAKAVKGQPAMLAAFLSGKDKALSKQEAADALGLKLHNLHRPRHCRSIVLPVVDLGRGYGRGWRYSYNSVQAQIAAERIHPGLRKKTPFRKTAYLASQAVQS